MDAAGRASGVGVGSLPPAQGTCAPSWLPTFGGRPGMTGVVRALTVFDDGGGPALYAGGSFALAGGVAASHVAKWNGSTWAALGSGIVQAQLWYRDSMSSSNQTTSLSGAIEFTLQP